MESNRRGVEMKKQYVKPIMIGEKFAADEFVSTCYAIACSIGLGAGNSGRRDDCCNHSHTQKTNGSGCGHAKNQYIQHISGEGDNAVYRIIEMNNDTYDPLPCYFYPADNIHGEASDTIIGLQQGQTIYWKTDVGYFGTVWMHHQGTVDFSDTTHPNRS